MMLVSHSVKAPIVSEIRDKDNLTVVRKSLHLNHRNHEHEDKPCQSYGVVPVAGYDIVGGLLVQAALQPGLSKVIHHLLDYGYGDGNEVYINHVGRWPQLVGQTFGNAVFMFDGAVILGVMSERLHDHPSCPPGCGMLLSPPDDFVLEDGDQICAVAASGDGFKCRLEPAYHCAGLAAEGILRDDFHCPNLLICNWRDDMEDVFREIDQRVAAGTVVTALSGLTEEDRNEKMLAGGGLKKLNNLKIRHVRGQTVKHRVIKDCVNETDFDGVIIFSSGQYDVQTADARAAVCSLLIQSLLLEKGQTQERLIVELKDRQAVQLLKATGAANFVIGNELSSMMMVHLARNPDLRYFWIDHVFSSHGANMHVVKLSVYIDCSNADRVAEMSFWDLVATCRVKGAIPFGFRHPDDEIKWQFNPKDKDVPLELRADDLIAVVARHSKPDIRSTKRRTGLPWFWR